jgi:nuclear cap-binding protein subunit 1
MWGGECSTDAVFPKEFDPQLELPHVATQLQENLPGYLMPISEAFRTGFVFSSLIVSNFSFEIPLPSRVTEQPFKIPYYASLLSLLTSESPPLPEAEAEAAASTSQAPGKAVLDEFLKFFQEFLDKLAWRDLRTCVSLLEPLCNTT